MGQSNKANLLVKRIEYYFTGRPREFIVLLVAAVFSEPLYISAVNVQLVLTVYKLCQLDIPCYINQKLRQRYGTRD